MNFNEEYQVAAALASTLRFRESRKVLEGILEKRPGNVDALVLLAKVEYYLRDYSASRRRFETALLYDPGNIPAYFGLQYFRERRKNLISAAFLVLVVLLLFAMGIGLYSTLSTSLESGVSEVSKGLTKNSENLKSEIVRLENLYGEYSDSLQTMKESDARELEELATKLEQMSDRFGRLQRDMVVQLQGIAELVERQDETSESLSRRIDHLLREIQDMRMEYYQSP